ncbi:MAG: pyridoxamine kinase [Spirochaetia bacterium]|nr:pyridoxamine kinase [Spirochaetia bacterium]
MEVKKLVPEVAAIHDLSGYGRSALTVVIPVLSSMGVQVCPLPTAIFSTQTDGFENYAMMDLGDFMPEIEEHWKSLNLKFDAIYSGFLGSSDQISFVADFISKFRKKDQIILVDPVLGDCGLPYGPITGNHIRGMKKLIKNADIITPNVTEAAMLLGRELKSGFSYSEVRDWLHALSLAGPSVVMITSVHFRDEDNNAVCVYDKKADKYMKFSFELIHGSYPGTGDTFASIVLGSLLKGSTLAEAVHCAVKFLSSAILLTNMQQTPNRNGLLLEYMLPELNKKPLDEGYEYF